MKVYPSSERFGQLASNQSSINQKTDVFGDGLLVIFWIFTALENGPRRHVLDVEQDAPN